MFSYRQDFGVTGMNYCVNLFIYFVKSTISYPFELWQKEGHNANFYMCYTPWVYNSEQDETGNRKRIITKLMYMTGPV